MIQVEPAGASTGAAVVEGDRIAQADLTADLPASVTELPSIMASGFASDALSEHRSQTKSKMRTLEQLLSTGHRRARRPRSTRSGASLRIRNGGRDRLSASCGSGMTSSLNPVIPASSVRATSVKLSRIRVLATSQDRAVRKSRQCGAAGGGHFRGFQDDPVPVWHRGHPVFQEVRQDPGSPARRRARRQAVFRQATRACFSAIPASCFRSERSSSRAQTSQRIGSSQVDREGPGESHLRLMRARCPRARPCRIHGSGRSVGIARARSNAA